MSFGGLGRPRPESTLSDHTLLTSRAPAASTVGSVYGHFLSLKVLQSSSVLFKQGCLPPAGPLPQNNGEPASATMAIPRRAQTPGLCRQVDWRSRYRVMFTPELSACVSVTVTLDLGKQSGGYVSSTLVLTTNIFCNVFWSLRIPFLCTGTHSRVSCY